MEIDECHSAVRIQCATDGFRLFIATWRGTKLRKCEYRFVPEKPLGEILILVEPLVDWMCERLRQWK